MKELAEVLIRAFPEMDNVKRRVALATYRRLAHGEPVSQREIANEAGVAVTEYSCSMPPAYCCSTYRRRKPPSLCSARAMVSALTP